MDRLSSTLLFLSVLSGLILSLAEATERPIVGILTQELNNPHPNVSSYMAASYVKAVEAAGARVVPIFINRTDDYYRKLMSKVNGVVLPGGTVEYSVPGGYAAAGRLIVAIAEELQDSGITFPILGVCQGYELLMFLAANTSTTQDILVDCDAKNVSLPLKFRPGFQESQLYRHASDEVLDILKNLPVTANYHEFCVTEEKLKQHSLEKTWRILSTNKDKYGLEFISSSEHFQRPLAGVQFHPEKNLFEWNPSQANPHSRKAILSARHFYDWLVATSRLNDQKFPTQEEEEDSLIYNYTPEYIGKKRGFNEQIYYF